MARVCNGSNWLEIGNNTAILDFKPQPLGNRHKPVNHLDILNDFQSQAETAHIELVNQRGFLSPTHDKYIHVADVKSGLDDLDFSFAWINSHDRTSSFKLYFGHQVFVCSNMTFDAENQERRKHTGKVSADIKHMLNNGFDKFNAYCDNEVQVIDTMKSARFNDKNLAKLTLDLHRAGITGNTFINGIINEYDNPSHDCFKARNTWNMWNHVTERLKTVKNVNTRVQLSNTIRPMVMDIAKIAV